MFCQKSGKQRRKKIFISNSNAWKITFCLRLSAEITFIIENIERENTKTNNFGSSLLVKVSQTVAKKNISNEYVMQTLQQFVSNLHIAKRIVLMGSEGALSDWSLIDLSETSSLNFKFNVLQKQSTLRWLRWQKTILSERSQIPVNDLPTLQIAESWRQQPQSSAPSPAAERKYYKQAYNNIRYGKTFD